MSLLLIPLGKEDFADGVKANRAPLKRQSTSDSDTATNITFYQPWYHDHTIFWEHHSVFCGQFLHLFLRLNII